MMEKLDTPSGHILVCIFLLLLFIGLDMAGYAWSHDPMEMALGTVYLAINVKRSGTGQ
jgi:predicted tellurium resistance membrane protein TerC